MSKRISNRRLFLGIDIGTSGLKLVAIDDYEKQVVFSATSTYPTDYPRETWAEQNPSSWITALHGVLEEFSKPMGTCQIAGIGVTGQMHTLVVTDSKFSPLRPAILWSDLRGEQYCQPTMNAFPDLVPNLGGPLLPNYSLAKLLWIKDNEPTVYAQMSHAFLPKDWIVYYLTGVLSTDVSDASGTWLYNIAKRRWVESLFSNLDLPPSLFPAANESSAIVGCVANPQLPAWLQGSPVIAGCGDQAAAAIGTGTLTPGEVSCSLGTSGVIFSPTDEYYPAIDGRINSFCFALPQSWHVMTVTQSAAQSFQWAAKTLGHSSDFTADVISQSSSSVIFLPYLMGERSPVLSSQVKGAFVGLSLNTTRDDLLLAVLEGVAFSLYDCWSYLKPLVPLHKFTLTGGGASSNLWSQIMADVFGHPMFIMESNGGAAYGVSLLTAAAIDRLPFKSLAQIPQVFTTVYPDSARHVEYGKLFKRYVKLSRYLVDQSKSTNGG